MSNYRFFLVYICVSFVIVGCKNKHAVAVRDFPLKTSQELVVIATQNDLEYEQFSAKISASVRTPQRSNSFRATIRIRRDSAIWASVTPAMGIEAFRVLCTRDSVKYIDKLNKQYFLGTYKKLNEITKSQLDLGAIQDVLLGNALYFDPELKYRAHSDPEGYHLATRNTDKLKRMAGVDEVQGLIVPTDSTANAERKLHRLQNRKDDDELIVRQYWFDYSHGKLVQTVFTDLLTAQFLTAVYGQFEPVDNQLIPIKTYVELGNSAEQATFDLEYSRIKLNTPLSMPFSIPDKYEAVR